MYLLIKIFEISDVPCFWISYVGTWRGIRVWYTKSASIKFISSRSHNIIKTSCCAVIPIHSVIIIMRFIISIHVLLRRFSFVLNVHLLLVLNLLLVNLIRESNTVNLWHEWVALGHFVGDLVLLSLDSESVYDCPLGPSTWCSCVSWDSRMDGNFLHGLR